MAGPQSEQGREQRTQELLSDLKDMAVQRRRRRARFTVTFFAIGALWPVP